MGVSRTEQCTGSSQLLNGRICSRPEAHGYQASAVPFGCMTSAHSSRYQPWPSYRLLATWGGSPAVNRRFWAIPT